VTVPPAVVVDNPIPVEEPEQIVCEAGVALTVGAGLTVTSTVMAVPLQVPNVGVMVYLTTAGELVLLVNVWVIVLPLPLEKPVAVPLLRAAVQEKVTVPPVVVVDNPIPVAEPEHIV